MTNYYKRNVINKFFSVLVLIILACSIFSNVNATNSKNEIKINIESSEEKNNPTEEEIINDYTWSVIKYCDWFTNQVNSENIRISQPTYGPLLVLTDFMSPDLCKVALDVYCENDDGSLDETGTLIKLAKYVNDSVVHYFGINEKNTPDLDQEDIFDNPAITSKTGKKISAQEMAVLGDYYLDERYDFIGDCGSVSSFITAVLRLCGFSAISVFNVGFGGQPLAIMNFFPFIFKTRPIGHYINLICADEKWYVIDGTMWYNQSYGRLFTEDDKYQISKLLFIKDNISNIVAEKNRIFYKDQFNLLENDKYFLGSSWQDDPFWKFYSNMNKEDFRNTLLSAMKKGFKNAKFSNIPYISKRLFLSRISNRVTENPYVSTIGLPYTVKDAVGETIQVKASYLAKLNREFIDNHKNVNGLLNQYDKAFYAYGYINVSYPQAYANAARLAGHTSWFGYMNDSNTAYEDVNNTINLIKQNFTVNPVLNKDQVAFSDFTYVLRNGSTLDLAVFAYGAIRNMKKDDDFWSADDLFVIVTDNNTGYLAVNITGNEWTYLNFEEGNKFKTNIENIRFAFNEKIKKDDL